jgi:hypothetical protein
MGIIGVGCAWIGFPGKDSLAVELFSQLYRFDNPFFFSINRSIRQNNLFFEIH